jgi:CPA2 family monovalent cation:H+ antiporter-2
MPDHLHLLNQLLIILAAGCVAGLICKQLKVSMLVGYLLAGMLLGRGALGWVEDRDGELTLLAEGGVLLLLFSIGLEFSLDELGRLSRYLVVGGATQMALVIGPVMLFSMFMGKDWRPALLIGAAVSFSSTVLVFKALAEWGQTDSPQGKRAIGILLFQDVALVPLLLFVPFLASDQAAAGAPQYALLGVKAAAFVAGVLVLRATIERLVAPLLMRQRSPELVVLSAIVLFGSVTWVAHHLSLPPAIGAFAAGLAFSGNRLTGQVDALVLPFRETFAAVFFVSLGLLLEPQVFWDEIAWIVPGLIAIIALKTAAAAVALRLTGLRWRTSWATGIGLSQLGEFSFVLVLAGTPAVLSEVDYDRILCFALATLVLTPMLLRLGIRWAGDYAPPERDDSTRLKLVTDDAPEAIVVGIGLAGRQVASQLEMAGYDACLVDLSPVNLHHFAQQGFRTIAGDASDPDVLRRAGLEQAGLVVICVPHDQAATQVVRSVRLLKGDCFVLVRCRYASNARLLKKAGASEVVSEEAEASLELLRVLRRIQGDSVPVNR